MKVDGYFGAPIFGRAFLRLSEPFQHNLMPSKMTPTA
jgi:hypothetical protein